MKKSLLSIAVLILISLPVYGQINVPATSPVGGPLTSAGALITFTTGGASTAIQENWGINLCGVATQPIRVYNTSLLVGYQGYSQNFGTGNALISGKLGIGTTNPTAKLTLAGNGNVNPNTGPETDYDGLNITFKGESGGSGFNLGSVKMVQPAGAFIDNADMIFSTSLQTLTEKMRISGSGNVSIGTPDSKGYKLAVNGSAIATSMTVKLYSAWPDYVFKPFYNLKPLSELKTYVDQNHHLPEMPSEKEVVNKGLDLGEMNRLLLQKVEELTLYLIQQKEETEKQNKAQQQQIDELKNKLLLWLNRRINK